MERDERKPAAPTRARARVRATASQLGFLPPPVTVRLKLLEGSRYWSLFLQPQEETSIAPVVGWLEPWSPLRIEFGSRKVIRADFDPLPEAWLTRFGGLDVEMLVLYPNGAALASLAGPHAALAGFGRMFAGAARLDVQEVRGMPRDTPLLTSAQDEALRAAVDAGYYRIPRPINLHKLAARMGISPASLSERLRRAEGRIILRYATEGATTPWDARTIFDAHDLHPPDDDPPGVWDIPEASS